MNKKFTDNQVERLLDLVPYLSSNPGVALEKISADFQVSKKTILEDLNTLWMCGLPGYTPLELIDLSFDTGFVTIRNAEILSRTRRLSAAEIAAIILGLSMLRESLPESNVNQIVISELISKLSTIFEIPIPAAVDEQAITHINSQLLDAIKSKGNVSIRYFSYAKDEESTRIISPLRFRVIDNQEYLEAYCNTSNDFRSFRVDRITNCEVLNDSQGKATETQNRVEPEIEFDIAVHSRARKVFELFNIAFPSGDAKTKEFSTHAFNIDWIIRSVFSLNSSAILLKPIDIREQIVSRAEKALKLYT